MSEQIGMRAGAVKGNSTGGNITTSLFHQLEFFSESFGCSVLQHGLVFRIITGKIFPHLVKRIVPLCRNLPAHHSPAFPDGGSGFSVKTQLAGYRVAVFGAFGAIIRNISSRSKGKNNRPRWYFAGYVDYQPVVSRNFYGLCNSHEVTIA